MGSIDESGNVGQRLHRAVDGVVATEDQGLPVVGGYQPEQDPHQRALAGTVGTQQAVHLSGLDRQVDAGEGRHLAKGFPQSGYLDGLGHRLLFYVAVPEGRNRPAGVRGAPDGCLPNLRPRYRKSPPGVHTDVHPAG